MREVCRNVSIPKFLPILFLQIWTDTNTITDTETSVLEALGCCLYSSDFYLLIYCVATTCAQNNMILDNWILPVIYFLST